jgi:hypothetical protein
VKTQGIQTRSAFCFHCRQRKIFRHVRSDSYGCPDCGNQRSITIEGAEACLDGDAGRFWSSVKITPFCWPWMRISKRRAGPVFQIGRSSFKVARAAYFFSRGVWPIGGAFRRCGNSLCVKPAHLIDLGQADISRTLIKSGRLSSLRKPKMSRCKRGHKFAGDNISIQSGSKRFCRTCRNLVNRRRYRDLKTRGVTV